jgi:hypothetical protein
MKLKHILSFALLAIVGYSAYAQTQPSRRIDDHFWRRRVTLRLDLQDKINKPLTRGNATIRDYVRGGDPKFGLNTRGMVYALMNAWRSPNPKVVAYNADTLAKVTDVATFERMYQKFTGGGATATTGGTDESGGGEGDETDLGLDGDEGDLDGGLDAGADDPAADPSKADIMKTGTVPGEANYDAMELFMEIIEDRIFDKIQGQMVHSIKFVRFVLSNPDGVPPDQNVLAFKYDDPIVQEILNNTQYKNNVNDAEDRSIKEVFDMRLFNGVISGVSGINSNTLEEAEVRKQQIIAFEHNLWSY